MGATTQHQCGTQIYPIYNRNRGIDVGPWREGPSSTTGQGENHHARPDTGFSQPIKFQKMGATTQHQCGTQIYPIYNCNRGIEVGLWREGPSSTTGHGENHHDRPRHRVFTANKVPRNGCYHPTPMSNTNISYLQS
jgi:hypothetical protein